MRSRLYKLLPAAAITALAFTMACALIDDPDVWWHLKCGELLVRGGRILHSEIFSYTAAGAPWVDGYLVTQAVLYIFWALGGAAGVCLLGAATVALTWAVSLKISSRNSAAYALAIVTSLPALFLSRATLTVRPALAVPLFSLFTLWILENYRLRGGRRIFLLIPLTALWASSHPSFLLGTIITFCYLLGGRLGPKGRKTVLIVLVGQLFSTLATPYHYRIYYSVVSMLSNPGLKNAITEWRPIYMEPSMPHDLLLCLIGIAAILFSTLLWRRFRVLPAHVMLFVFFYISAVFGRRNLLLFCVMSIPLISWSMEEAVGKTEKIVSHISRNIRKITFGIAYALSLSVSLFLLWYVGTDRLYFSIQIMRKTGLGVQGSFFPKGEVQFMLREPVKGNLFHPYHLGGYLIFNLYPKYKVFIDGRIFPYPYDLFLREEKSLVSLSAFESLVPEYDLKAVLVPIFPEGMWHLMKYLMQSPDWAAVKADQAGVLFLKRGAGNDGIISRFEIDLKKEPPPLYDPPAGRKYHLWDKAEYPYGPASWYRFYEFAGFPDLAARCLKPALNYRPQLGNLNSVMGSLLLQAGKLKDGIEYIDRALAKNPRNVTALSAQVNYFIALKDYDRAENILLKIVDIDPENASAWNTLGELAYNRGELDEAVMRFQKAASLDSGVSLYWERLGLGLERSDPRRAAEAYRKAIDIMLNKGAPPEDVDRVRGRLDILVE